VGVRVSVQVVELERLPVGRVVFVDLKNNKKTHLLFNASVRGNKMNWSIWVIAPSQSLR